ncbi:MAG: helix-turn-helix domain-containing protein [Spirochaetes bacterium]|nr:helix-turn-helix domain-containing protein [Spirochaetota bacterium]
MVPPESLRRSRKLDAVPIDTRPGPRLSHFGLHHGVDWERFGDHEHGGVEFFYFMDGRARVDLGAETRPRQATRALEVAGSDLLAIAPGYRHHFHLDGTEISYYWFGVREAAARRTTDAGLASALEGIALDVQGELGLGAQAPVVHLKGFSAARALLAALHREMVEQRPGWEGLVGIHLLHFLALARRHREGAPGGPVERMRIVEEFLGSHLDRRLDLAELADRCGMNPAALVRAYRRERGRTPAEAHLDLRLGEAERLLAAGRKPREVTERLGFKTLQHFSAAFRKKTGYSPRAWTLRLTAPA